MEGKYVGDGWLKWVLLAEAGKAIAGWVLWVLRESCPTPFPAVCPRGPRLARNWDVSPNNAVSISGSFLSPSSQLEGGWGQDPAVHSPAPLPGH